MKCSQCGLEFEGESCPKCGNSVKVSKKKPIYKRWWFIVLVIIAGILVIGKFLGGPSSSEKKPEKFNWSSFSLHEKLPEPKSNEGKNFYDYSDSLDITVCETSKSDYNDYVKKCETDYGFINDKKKTSDTFSAVNGENYSVLIYYDDDDKEMNIYLKLVENDDSSETSEKTETTASASEVKPAESKPQETKSTETKPVESGSSNGMSKEFKNAMDSYENFMNEYVDFMKKYNNNPSDLTLLAEYSKYVKKYSDMCDKFDKWQNEDLNSTEMAYYIDVQGRVSKKLLEVAN